MHILMVMPPPPRIIMCGQLTVKWYYADYQPYCW